MELCAETENINGEVFIIAGGTPVLVSELVDAISRELGVRPPVIHLPLFLGLAAGFSLEQAFKILGKQPPFSRRSLDFFLKHNAYDIRKAERMLGYHPRVDLHTGLQRTISAVRTAGKESLDQ
jgi:nucleoside-diphosphate-sugar epimerase